VINRRKNDGSNAVWNETVPRGPGKRFSSESPPKLPLLPLWSTVKPWLVNKSDEATLMLPPPSVYNSQQFNQSLREVKQISDNRTTKQLQIAQFRADGVGTVTPPGHWNQIACDLISSYHLNELRSARTVALMNATVMDAGIHCWNCKYTYWYIRPSQADPTITTPVGLPNFPSYVSGHSSFSAAAGDVLSYLFPTERSELQAQVQEASLSRLYASIHYRFDCDQGLKVGRGVAQLAIQHGMHDGSPP
jgi:PAP2 superfamily protein